MIEGILQIKGQEIVDIDLTKINSTLCDHFIICHAESGTQVGAIADSVEKLVKESLNIRVGHREGMQNASWVLLDFSDIVVHIFQREIRDYYKIEELWGDAHQTKIEESYN
ncbi:MAG: ribosome silencing factor [Bacteroidales bacterium]|nr:ribosome silencing factor [Bacteroidales bacterium]